MVFRFHVRLQIFMNGGRKFYDFYEKLTIRCEQKLNLVLYILTNLI